MPQIKLPKPRPKRAEDVTVDQAVAELNAERVRQDLKHGAVETIVVFDAHGKLKCLKRYIDAKFFFAHLNMNCSGARGSHTTCQVSYPRDPVLGPAYRRGLLVQASSLGITANPSDPEEDFWIAICNVPLAGDSDVQCYPYDIRDETLRIAA